MKYCFLLPAYKAVFFREALNSILNQTFQDFEVVVSDDCSPEDIKSIVDDFSDSRITYRRNDHNIGAENLVDHWNLLLDLTDAEYVIMASDDDIYCRTFLESIDSMTLKYPDINVFRPRIQQINSAGEIIKTEKRLNKDFLNRNEYLKLFGDWELFSGVPQYVFKLKPLLLNGGFKFFPAAWFSDDITVASLCDNGMGIADEVLFGMRLSNVSISSGKQPFELVKEKIVASVQYSCELSAFSDATKEVVSKLRQRAEYVTWYLLLELSFPVFFKSILFLFTNRFEMYPFIWQLRCCKHYLLKRIR